MGFLFAGSKLRPRLREPVVKALVDYDHHIDARPSARGRGPPWIYRIFGEESKRIAHHADGFTTVGIGEENRSFVDHGLSFGTVEKTVTPLDSDRLFDTANRIVNTIAAKPGTAYVRHDWENKIPRIDITIDQARARRAGVTSREVALALSTFVDGQKLSEYREGDETIPIVLQAAQDQRDVFGDLWNTHVNSPLQGKMVPLTQVADFRAVWDFNRIARKDQERTVTIETNHEILKAPELLEALRPALDAIDFDDRMRWEIGGEIEFAQGRA